MSHCRIQQKINRLLLKISQLNFQIKAIRSLTFGYIKSWHLHMRTEIRLNSYDFDLAVCIMGHLKAL